MGGLAGPRQDRQDVDRAEAGAERREQRGDAVGAEDDDEPAAGFQHRGGGAEPEVEAAFAEDMRRRARLPGGAVVVAGTWKGGLVMTASAMARVRPGRFACGLRRLDIGHDDGDARGEGPVGRPLQGRAGAGDGLGIAIGKDDPDGRASRRRDHAGNPGAGAEIDDGAGEIRFQRCAEENRLQSRAVMAARSAGRPRPGRR